MPRQNNWYCEILLRDLSCAVFIFPPKLLTILQRNIDRRVLIPIPQTSTSFNETIISFMILYFPRKEIWGKFK